MGQYRMAINQSVAMTHQPVPIVASLLKMKGNNSMLTIDEKIDIVKEKINNLIESINYARIVLQEIDLKESDRVKDEFIGFILKQRQAIKYFSNILEGLKNGIDPV